MWHFQVAVTEIKQLLNKKGTHFENNYKNKLVMVLRKTTGPFIKKNKGKIRRELYHLYEHVLSNKTSQ